MAIRQKENVFADAIHVETWLALHDFEIKGGKKIGAAQGAARMAALHFMHHTHNIAAHLRGHFVKLPAIHFFKEIMGKSRV